MEKSERVLKALSDHSQSSDYKYERLYRYLFSEEMFAVAYQRIYAKQGNMTPGTDGGKSSVSCPLKPSDSAPLC